MPVVIKKPMGISIRATFKRRFIAGLFVTIPGVITFLVIGWFFRFVDGILEPVYSQILGYYTPGLGFLSAVVLIFIVGLISTNVFGKKIIQFFEKVLMNIPVLSGFYTGVKQLVDAFSPDSQSASFKKFVIIEYPRAGAYSFGFLTNECTIKRKESKTCLRTVYVPTNHLYLGDIVLVSEEDVFYTELPIDEGIKIILSGGIAAPVNIVEAKQ